MPPREKPQPAGATNSRSEQKPGPKKLGGLSKPTKKPRRWVPKILVAAAITIIATAGMLVVDRSESEDSPSTSVTIIATYPLNHGATKEHDNTHSRLAGLLASLTRPAAVITIDVAALKDRDWTNALPRITNWFENYLKLPIAEVDQIVAVGAAADDFSIAITTSAPLTSATLTERLGPPQAENVYYLDALSGPLAVRLLDDATLIVSHRDNASKPPESAPLPEALERQLQTAAGNVLLTIDHELTDKANTPFFLSPPNDTLNSKTATISVTSLVQLNLKT